MTVYVDYPKSDGENPKAMTITSGQTFRAEPLSNRTDDTLRPEQATTMNKGRTWLDPSGGKSSSKKNYACSPIRCWKVDQSLGGGSSVNSNLTKSPDQRISMCAR